MKAVVAGKRVRGFNFSYSSGHWLWLVCLLQINLRCNSNLFYYVQGIFSHIKHLNICKTDRLVVERSPLREAKSMVTSAPPTRLGVKLPVTSILNPVSSHWRCRIGIRVCNLFQSEAIVDTNPSYSEGEVLGHGLAFVSFLVQLGTSTVAGIPFANQLKLYFKSVLVCPGHLLTYQTLL